MSKIRFFILTLTIALCGCTATERLRNNTVTMSASTTDVYYQMVLQNLARAYAEPNVLPWGIELASGNVAVNDSGQLNGGYSETWPKVVPSTTGQVQRVLQQGWTTAPVANMFALLELRTYYSAVVDHAKDPSKPKYISVTDPQPRNPDTNEPLPANQFIPIASTPPVTTTSQTIDYVTNAVDYTSTPATNTAAYPASFPTTPNSPVLSSTPSAPVSVPGTPLVTAGSSGYNTVTQSWTSVDPAKGLLDIDLSCFKFCTGPAPKNTISGSYKSTTVYVYKDVKDIHNLSLYTMLILGTIDQVPSKAPQAGATTLGPVQPSPLLR
jgi:hypothetical protein